MEAHQVRVVDERTDLARKIKALLAAERIRLVKQLAYMDGYHDMLIARIAAFPVPR